MRSTRIYDDEDLVLTFESRFCNAQVPERCQMLDIVDNECSKVDLRGKQKSSTLKRLE